MPVGISILEAQQIIKLADLYATEAGQLAILKANLADEGNLDGGYHDRELIDLEELVEGRRQAVVEFVHALLTPAPLGTPA